MRARFSASYFLPTAALVVGLACGSAARRTGSLPPAGSPRDDGSGLLARASAGLRIGAGRGYGNASYTTGSWGGYGGSGYGAASYGGGIYASYKFERSATRDSDVNHYDPAYVVSDKLKTGRIRGQLRWTRRPDRLGGACATAAPTSARAKPTDAIVFLRSIKRGRGFAKIDGSTGRITQRGGTLRVYGCRLDPYVQVVGPIGATLNAHLEHDGPDELEIVTSPAIATLRLTSRGDVRFAQLRRAGPVKVKSRSGATAWLYVAGHPYHVNVDADGTFTLLDVPAGNYELVAWHPPIPGGAPTPLTTARHIRVHPEKEAHLRLTLPSP